MREKPIPSAVPTLGRLMLGVVALGLAAAAWSPTPADAAITVFTKANPAEPAATLTRFTCRVTRPGTPLQALTVNSVPSGGFRFQGRLPFTSYGQQGSIFYGVPDEGPSGAFVIMRTPGGTFTNLQGGPPGLSVAGAYTVGRRSFGAGVIGIGGADPEVSFAGGGTCPKPKKPRRRR